MTLSYQGRVLGSNVWSTLGFLPSGVFFMLIGLELPAIAFMRKDNRHSNRNNDERRSMLFKPENG